MIEFHWTAPPGLVDALRAIIRPLIDPNLPPQ